MVILQLEQQPMLIQAIFTGDLEEVRSALDFKPDVNYQDCEKRSPLHAASFKGDAEIAQLLLTYGARVNTKDNRWITPLHRACCCGSSELVSLLLRHQADTTSRDRHWQTPLHVAAANNALECVVQLLQCVPNPNVTDRMGRTALHHAAVNGHNDVVELLLSKGCIVNACDKKDSRPIHCAAHMGHVDTIELLLRSGADINAKDRNQYSPLHVAAASGMVSACRVLLGSGGEINARNAYGNSSLHIACLNGHLPVCNVLVSFGADIEAGNYRGQTPLHIAAASTHGVDCLNFLVEQKVNINKQSLDGRSALHMTAIHGRFTRSKILIDKGAIVDCVDKNGCTALHIAAQYGHDLLANTLLSYGADAARKGYAGRTPLHMSCLSGYVECCRKFLQTGVDLNAQDDSGKTPIHCAAYKGSVECLDLLVSNGANFNLLDKIGRIPLHYAAVQGHYPCVFTLVGLGSPINLCDSEGCSPLHLAAAYDVRGECVEYLLRHKADPKLKDLKGFTPVHYAVAGGNRAGLGFLLSVVGNNYIMHGNDMPLTTPLHLAAKNGNQDILRLLLSYFHDTNIRTEQGSTALLLAAKSGHTHCVQMLLRFGAKVAITDSIQHMSPVHYSARNGHMHCLALLLDNAEDKRVVDLQDSLQRTALMMAVAGGHSESALTLLKCNADSNIVDADKHSSLFRAVVNGQHNAVQLLISHGAEVDKPDVHGKTVLHLAAACGHLSSLQTILKNMEPPEMIALDNQECTALHWACYNGNPNCVSFLLEKDIFKDLGGNVFSPIHCATFVGTERCIELLCNYYGTDIVKFKDARNRTPLHIAALHGHVDCAKYLLEKGAEIDCKDADGRTPIIAASQNGQSQIIELFLSNKADLTSYDNNGNTALHLACLKRHSHSALLLLDNIDDIEIVNMINNDRKTPLHLSARNGLVNVTRQLIGKGSSVLAVDANGMTPALCCAPNSSVAQCLALILANYTICSQQNSKAESVSSQRFLAVTKQSSTKKLKTYITVTSQTDISLLQNPDYFECRRLFNVHNKTTPRVKKRSQEQSNAKPKITKNEAASKSDCLKMNVNEKVWPLPRSSIQLPGSSKSNCIIAENYIPSGPYRHQIEEKRGYILHRSHSDMSIAYEGNHYDRDSFKRIMIDAKLKKNVNVLEPKWRIRHEKSQENQNKRRVVAWRTVKDAELDNTKHGLKSNKTIKEIAEEIVTLYSPRMNIDNIFRALQEATLKFEETWPTPTTSKDEFPSSLTTETCEFVTEQPQLKQMLENTMRKVQEQECSLDNNESQEFVAESPKVVKKVAKQVEKPNLKSLIRLQQKKGFLNIQTYRECICKAGIAGTSSKAREMKLEPKSDDKKIVNAKSSIKKNAKDVQELYVSAKMAPELAQMILNLTDIPKIKVIETGSDDDIIKVDQVIKQEQLLEMAEMEKLQNYCKRSSEEEIQPQNSTDDNAQQNEPTEKVETKLTNLPTNLECIMKHVQVLNQMVAKGTAYFPQAREIMKHITEAITEHECLDNIETFLNEMGDAAGVKRSDAQKTFEESVTEAKNLTENVSSTKIEDCSGTSETQHVCSKISAPAEELESEKVVATKDSSTQSNIGDLKIEDATCNLVPYHAESVDIISDCGMRSKDVEAVRSRLTQETVAVYDSNHDLYSIYKNNVSADDKLECEEAVTTKESCEDLDTSSDVISGTISFVPYLSVEKEMETSLRDCYDALSEFETTSETATSNDGGTSQPLFEPLYTSESDEDLQVDAGTVDETEEETSMNSSMEEKEPKVSKKNSLSNIAKKKLLRSKDNQQCCVM